MKAPLRFPKERLFDFEKSGRAARDFAYPSARGFATCFECACLLLRLLTSAIASRTELVLDSLIRKMFALI